MVGAILLISGASRNGKFERWKKDPYVLPTASFSPQIMQLGMVGRF